MNSKILRYGLIAGVVLVWGMIIQQVFSAMGDDNRNLASPVTDTAELPGMPVDTFSLLLNYSDPFLLTDSVDGAEMIANSTNIIPGANTIPVNQPEQRPDISFIRYMGMITNNERSSRVAIINFKGYDMMVREGQDVEDVTIKKIKASELSIVFRNKTFRLTKTNQ